MVREKVKKSVDKALLQNPFNPVMRFVILDSEFQVEYFVASVGTGVYKGF